MSGKDPAYLLWVQAVQSILFFPLCQIWLACSKWLHVTGIAASMMLLSKSDLVVLILSIKRSVQEVGRETEASAGVEGQTGFKGKTTGAE